MNAWNGVNWYVACGNEKINRSRSWEDFREYNFVSGGMNERASAAVRRIPENSRIFVHIPKRGYVGVGITLDVAKPIEEAQVHVDNEWVSLVGLTLRARCGLD